MKKLSQQEPSKDVENGFSEQDLKVSKRKSRGLELFPGTHEPSLSNDEAKTVSNLSLEEGKRVSQTLSELESFPKREFENLASSEDLEKELSRQEKDLKASNRKSSGLELFPGEHVETPNQTETSSKKDKVDTITVQQQKQSGQERQSVRFSVRSYRRPSATPSESSDSNEEEDVDERPGALRVSLNEGSNADEITFSSTEDPTTTSAPGDPGEDLLAARVVSDAELFEEMKADAVQAKIVESVPLWRRRWFRAALLMALFLVVGVIVLAVLLSRRSNSELLSPVIIDATAAPSGSPSLAPSFSPESLCSVEYLKIGDAIKVFSNKTFAVDISALSGSFCDIGSGGFGPSLEPAAIFRVLGTGERLRASTCSSFTDSPVRLKLLSGSCETPECILDDSIDTFCFEGNVREPNTLEWASTLDEEYYIFVQKEEAFVNFELEVQPVFRCIPDRDTLLDVVDSFLLSNSPDSTVVLTYGSIDRWCFDGRITDMSSLFDGYRNSAAESFNQDLSGWDVSSVTNMRFMFRKATAFNGSIASWDVSSVANMNSMFTDAWAFNQDLSSWDLSFVTLADYMFWDAFSFNGNISTWDVSSVTTMENMFSGASAFNQDISSWNVSAVTKMRNMFRGASSFNSDISLWDVSSVTDMGAMFYSAQSFDQNLCEWGPYMYGRNVILDIDAITYLGIFQETACPDQSSPEFTSRIQSGPFCHDCPSAPTASPAPTTTPAPSLFGEDTCTALLLSAGDVIQGSTMDRMPKADPCDTTFAVPSIWYHVIGTGNALTISTCSQNTAFDTLLSVSEGSCDDGLICLGYNDDSIVPCSSSSTQSTYTWDSEAGQDYFVMVRGFLRLDAGQFELNLFEEGVSDIVGATSPSPSPTAESFPEELPAGSSCASAESIAVGESSRFPSIAIGNNMNRPLALDPCSGETSSATWYMVVGTGDVLVATPSCTSDITDFSVAVSILEFSSSANDSSSPCLENQGFSCVELEDNQRTCVTPFDWRRKVWRSVEGKDYYLLVRGSGGAVGNYELQVSVAQL